MLTYDDIMFDFMSERETFSTSEAADYLMSREPRVHDRSNALQTCHRVLTLMEHREGSVQKITPRGVKPCQWRRL